MPVPIRQDFRNRNLTTDTWLRTWPLRASNDYSLHIRKTNGELLGQGITGLAGAPPGDENAAIRFRELSNGTGGAFVFNWNPQEIIRSQEARVNVQQTQRGSFVDEFGPGLPTWRIRGTFGWRARSIPTYKDDSKIFSSPGLRTDGYQLTRDFRRWVELYFAENQRRADPTPGAARRDLLQMIFADTYNQEQWVIEPLQLPEIRQVANQPLIYTYTWTFVGLFRLGDAFDPGSQEDDLLVELVNRRQALAALQDGLSSLEEFEDDVGEVCGCNDTG